MRRNKLVHLLIGALILPLAACAPLSVGNPTTGDDRSETSLANTHWRLVSYGRQGSETPVIDGSGLSLQFEEGSQAGGAAGCNTFGAQYEVSDRNLLSMTDIVSTLMACSDEALMEQEAHYLDALRSVKSFELNGESLTIRYEGGVLNFSRVTSHTPSTVNL